MNDDVGFFGSANCQCIVTYISDNQFDSSGPAAAAAKRVGLNGNKVSYARKLFPGTDRQVINNAHIHIRSGDNTANEIASDESAAARHKPIHVLVARQIHFYSREILPLPSRLEFCGTADSSLETRVVITELICLPTDIAASVNDPKNEGRHND